jgi:hypothetical protein
VLVTLALKVHEHFEILRPEVRLHLVGIFGPMTAADRESLESLFSQVGK